MVAVPDQSSRLLDPEGSTWAPWSEDVPSALVHVHRFAFAAGITAGRPVLDLSPGDGYGSALIAERAAGVLRVDADHRVVLHGRYNYGRPNLTFVHGQPLDAFNDLVGTIDTVVAFGWDDADAEVLAGKVAAELPAGLLLLSSGADPGTPLGRALRSSFAHVRSWSQWAGAHLAEQGGPLTAPLPLSVVVACSGEPIDAPAASSLEDYRFLGPRLHGAAPAVGVESPASVGPPEEWDATRLRRQLAAYSVAARQSVEDARRARIEAELARSDLQVREIELSRLRAELTARDQPVG